MFISPEVWSSKPAHAPHSLAGVEHHAFTWALPAAAVTWYHETLRVIGSVTGTVVRRALDSFRRIEMTDARLGSASLVSKRQSTSQSADVTIGVVVGVLLGVFFIGLFVFLYIYRKSVKFASKKRRRRKSGAGSSKSSKASSDGGGAPPAPPPPAPAPPPAA
jgi:hypothetical protein